METIFARLTVYFEDPFWVGVYEREEGGRLAACRIVFGAEPKDYEVYALLLRGWARLRFGPAVAGDAPAAPCKNPKRLQRAIRRELARRPGATRAQQALSAAREAAAGARREERKTRKKAETERKFQLRQQKKKQKRRGS